MSDTAIETAKQPPQSRLKQLASRSSWVSPFRSHSEDGDVNAKKKVNLHKQFREENKVEKIKVPIKFAHHPTLEAEARKKKLESSKKAASATEPAKKEGDDKVVDEPAIKGAKSENIVVPSSELEVSATDVVPSSELEVSTTDVVPSPELEVSTTDVVSSPIADAENAANENHQEYENKIEDAKNTIREVNENAQVHLEGNDDIEKLIKENPVDLDVEPSTKYEPVDLPNRDILEKLKDKPVLLQHYKELNATAIGALAHDIDDPKKVINLGSGLRMTQEQLMDMAAKRVAPVITSINEEVSKTRQEDEIRREQALEAKVKKHEGKLKSDFDKHVAQLNKKKDTFNQGIDRKLLNIENLKKRSTDTAKNFETTTKKEIETAKKEFEEREEKAAKQHVTDKENLEKNHEELLATKKQELEDAKLGQEKATQEIDELQERKLDLDNQNSELADEIEKLSATLNEKNVQLDELRSKYEIHAKAIDANLSESKVLDEKIDSYNNDVDKKKKVHKGLLAEIGVLSAALGAYASKLSDLDSDKKERTQRLADAKSKMSNWQQEKDRLAEEAARDHERKRAQATQEYETQKHQEELERIKQKDKEARLRREEEERQAKLKAEEEKRIAEEEAKKAQLEAEKEAEAKKLKEKKQKEEAVNAEIKKKEANQKSLEDERNIHDSLYEKGTYEGGEEAYRAAQKNRLRDEVSNLKKIRDLREEKATYTNEDPKLTEIDGLIQERENAIEKLNKEQAESKKKIETVPKEALQNKGAIEKKSYEETPVVSNQKKNNATANEATESKSDRSRAAGAAAGAAAGVTTGSVFADAKDHGFDIPTTNNNTAADYNVNKISQNYSNKEASVPKFEDSGAAAADAKDHGFDIPTTNNNTAADYNVNKISQNYSNKEASVPKFEDSGAAATGTTTTSAPKEDKTVGGVNGKDAGSKSNPFRGATHHDDASWDVQSVYEMISDGEFESHKQNPDYFEISEEEYDKHKQMEKEVTLVEKIV
ncbi:hypothetical protein KGF56_001713 [Candida oxycetoniae]|uniref:Eisosome protein 1 n=1 Tax=Candida oxycetoniae TaxID=497107 RepID=A0AAI9WZ51_9ASCO|nr:uncharacterized protein KGF56_001713 [Candida oxycetoniae]KAI3405694.1 hypothetical protein KGF56_001713 [Candida oxycetoniae]